MKFTTIPKTFTLLAVLLFILGADYITRDMIPPGSDVSRVRCNGGLIYTGDFSREVLEKCGEPIRETRISGEPYRIWVYQLGPSRHVYYLAFIHEKLQRIYYGKMIAR